MNEIVNRSLKRLRKIKDNDQCEEELFGIYSYILLNKNFFRYNSDLKEFVNPLLKKISEFYEKDIIFKDYVYKSRSLVVARFIRIIETSNMNVKRILIRNLSLFIGNEKEDEEKKIKKNKRKNTVDELLNRFERK